MCSKKVYALATVQWRFLTSIILVAFVRLAVAPVMAAEIATLEVESQSLDLDAGTVVEPAPEDMTAPVGADIKLAYNADRTPHAVVFPVAEGVEMSFVASVGFDGVSSSDIPNLVFSSEPTDLTFSANDCVVIRTDTGAVYKLGNAVESTTAVTFNYELIQ